MFDLDMSIQQFAGLFQENPCRLFKCIVSDRTKFKPNDDETRLIEPKELQDEIDKAIAQVTEGKAFVRPSGTEDILRLYAEAKTQAEMETLANTILEVIEHKFKNY